MISDMKEFRKGQTFSLQALGSQSDTPRYSLVVRDHSDDEMFAKRNMAVFVVPRGTERDLNIDSEETQAQVHDSAGHTRLVIVTLGKGQSFESLD